MNFPGVKKRDAKESLIDMRSRALMRWPALSYALLPIIILVFVLIASMMGYALTSSNLRESRMQAVERRKLETTLRMNADFNAYAQLLWGNAGLFQSGPMTEDDWRKFVDVYALKENFQGVEAIGIAYGNTPQTTLVTYVSPLTPDTEKAVGINAGLTPTILPAMVEAADSGEAKVTDTIPNLFSTKSDITTRKNGFLLFMPFYDTALPHDTVAQRQQTLRGYAIAAFRGDVFFKGTLESVALPHEKVQVYLGAAKPVNLQYQLDRTTDANQISIQQEIVEYGKTFTVVLTFDTADIVPFSINYLPQLLLFGGISLGIVIGVVAGYLLRNRYRSLIYQKEQDVNFAKDELLSLASHQLRTPATGVKQYLGMVLQGFAGKLTEQQKTYLERAYSSNNRQLHVINDILHLAKLEAGRIVLAEHTFDISDMIREVVDEQGDDAIKGEIVLKLRAPTRGLIVGDSHMLRMVVENLVSNAIKYTQPGGKVSVQLVQRGKNWSLIVKDTGVGIASKDLGKLFKQFSRISNSRSDFVTGTGIGLYLAHHLVVLHGGTISVASAEGKGSTFTVRLPRKA